MVKILIGGVWVLVVTLGAIFGALSWQEGKVPEGAPKEFFGGLDYVKSDILSVPILGDNEVKGYVVAQFVFTIDGNVAQQMSVPPQAFINSAGFSALYNGNAEDFENLNRYDLNALATTIQETVNKRFGQDLVQDVLIEQMNYVSKDEVRSKSAAKGRQNKNPEPPLAADKPEHSSGH